MIFDFEKTEKRTLKDKRYLTNLVEKNFQSLMFGKWQIEIRKPKRSGRQNRAIHALFEDLSVELEALGIEYKLGKFNASWTKESAKDFFKQIYLGGKGTSEVDTKTLADAVNKLLFDINRIGGQLSIKQPIK